MKVTKAANGLVSRSRCAAALLGTFSAFGAAACAGPGDEAESLGQTEQALCDNTDEDGCTCPGSPILIDVAGDGLRLTPWHEGVVFGLRPGTTSKLAWTAPGSDDAWLVLDRNGNGLVDDGSELFGNVTRQGPVGPGEERNGFRALASLDDNLDGRVDASDHVFGNLRLWRDENHDGRAQPAELTPLAAHGITGLGVDHVASKDVDAHGNGFRYRGTVYTAPGSTVGTTSWDVWLTGTKPTPVADAGAPEPGTEPAGPPGLAPRADAPGSDLACYDPTPPGTPPGSGSGPPPPGVNLRPASSGFVSSANPPSLHVPLGGQLWPFPYEVCNQNTVASGPFHANISIQQYGGGLNFYDEVYFVGLANNSCAVAMTAPIPFAHQPGFYAVTIDVDIYKVVPETHEGDNRRTRIVEVY
jgi:hypothetical protein